ncbi:hypothetical protein BpHYR1_044673 [Brachionus plicatilis]|uniref:Uncharacterized protein n=1 Tax=Brachionus plicatilis TaxID=10195 RepID=A0A3M7T2T8_BRAPC|nr:hypothetical protein BpHYR1_044673 [Brachionus plicatilis]
MIRAGHKANSSKGLSHFATFDSGTRSWRPAHKNIVADGDLVNSGFGNAFVLAGHGVLGSDDPQIARSLKIVLSVPSTIQHYVLVIKLPHIGQVNVDRFVGCAWQKKCLIYICNYVGINGLFDPGALHHIQVSRGGCTAQPVRCITKCDTCYDQIAVLQHPEPAAIAHRYIVLIPLDIGLGCTFWIAHNCGIAINSRSDCALHWLLDKSRLKFYDSEFGS